MSDEAVYTSALELLLARLLRNGTWLACAVTGLGIALSLCGTEGTLAAAAGVALFIALPVLRVLVMLGAFLLKRDYRLALFATAVLLTIAAGSVIGLCAAQPMAH